MRRLVTAIAAVLAVWMVVLLVLGFVLAAGTGRSVTARIGESLQATSTVGEASLGLVRGRLELEQLAVRRDDLIGKLALDVAAIDCDLPPLGLALIDRECSELAIRGVRLEVSTAALFELHRPKRTPIRVGRVIVRDATLVFAPSAFLPSLGRIQITIDHAAAGPTTFKTPLSFLFALEELRASLELPAGITMKLVYKDGVLGVTGSLFGSRPVELPIALPVAEASDDARGEIEKLRALGRDLAERLVARSALDWLGRKLAVP